MKPSIAKHIQKLCKSTNQPVSKLELQIRASPSLVQKYVAALLKEIECLQRHNAKQHASHFSALEKLKAHHAEELARDKVRIHLPDNGRDKR